MSGSFTRTLPPPANWQDFERLAFDVYGTDRIEGRYTGVQCKGKDQAYGGVLTVKELKEEVKKAKSFTPKLDVFVLATTAPNDVKLQRAARDITKAHRAKGLFEVRVTGWTTLAQKVTDYDDLVRKYYPDLAPIDVLARIDEATDVVRLESSEMRTVMESGNAAILAALEKKLDPGDPLQGRITDFAKLIEEGNPAASLRLLEKLWAEEASKASPRNRYRIRANMGIARLILGDVDKVISDMRAAYADDPTWPGARAILATAELHSGKPISVFEDIALQAGRLYANPKPPDFRVKVGRVSAERIGAQGVNASFGQLNPIIHGCGPRYGSGYQQGTNGRVTRGISRP